MTYQQLPNIPGVVNGHYLFDAATIIHRVIGSDRVLTGEQVDALSSIACGSLQLFLADADSGLVGDLGLSEHAYRQDFAITDEFVKLEREALLGIHVAEDFVAYCLSTARELSSQLDRAPFSHDIVIGRVRQFSMTTCGVGKMPFIGFFTENRKAIDPKTYKARLRRTEWGLIGIGFLILSASEDASTHRLSIPITEMSKALGSTFLGKALF